VQAQILEVLRTARDMTGAGVLIITHDLGWSPNLPTAHW
jgi:peptide/nickel transport system ATP-binding protein